MNNIKNYKDLLREENRIEQEIELSQELIEAKIKSYLKPKHLFSFLESKIEKEVDQEFSEEFEIKKYLISLSLDLLYEKLASSLLRSSKDPNSGIDWKAIAKTFVDQFYINNKSMLTDIVSDFIDENIKKWTNK
jgi:hypothetical protein